jgi:N-acetylglucosamine-6-phosphate deacetylase
MMSQRLLVTNGKVLDDDVLVTDKTVIIQEGRVVSITAEPVAHSSDAILDASGGYVLPGLIDQHSHGMRDVMVDKDDIHVYARYQLDSGVTACLPTLAGSPSSNIARMKSILAETNDFHLTPNLVGFRPEIMYVADASAGPATSVALPKPGLTEAVWEASGGRIKIWDISPELEGAPDRDEPGTQYGEHSAGACGRGGWSWARDAFLRSFPDPPRRRRGSLSGRGHGLCQRGGQAFR